MAEHEEDWFFLFRSCVSCSDLFRTDRKLMWLALKLELVTRGGLAIA